MLGLHTQAFTLPVPNDHRTHLELLRTCLHDPSPAVRLAAAHALCDWGEVGKALPVILAALKEPLESTRLLAVTVLDQIGEQARPVLNQVSALVKGGYPGRILKHLERRFRR